MVGAPIDVLLTQYSYANWVGNPEDTELRRAEARQQLERIGLQIDVLEPRHVIPFASMVWFCHEENYYLNDGMNSVEDAHRFIDERGADCVVLYPGERWAVGERHDSEASLARYAPHYVAIADGPELVTSPSVELAELHRLAERFFRLLRQHNPGWALSLAGRTGMLRPAAMYLWDHEQAVELGEPGLRRIDRAQEQCDVALGSESLAYMLRFLWGGATVAVNGRFRATPGGKLGRFQRWILVANYNNRGWSILDYLPVALTRVRDRLETVGRSG